MLESHEFLLSLVNSANFKFMEGTKLFQEFSSSEGKFPIKKCKENFENVSTFLDRFLKIINFYLEMFWLSIYQRGHF